MLVYVAKLQLMSTLMTTTKSQIHVCEMSHEMSRKMSCEIEILFSLDKNGIEKEI